MEVVLPEYHEPNPWKIRRLLRFAETQRETLLAKGHETFHPSPYWRVFRTLLALGPGEGKVFLEWGCGFGTIATFAGMLGYEAYGLDVEEKFVEAARLGARELDVEVEFGCGSYVPAEFEIEEFPSSHVELDVESGYDELDLAPQDADVVYVYPWPDDETFHRELFRETAHEGATLITFEGPDPVIVPRNDLVVP